MRNSLLHAGYDKLNSLLDAFIEKKSFSKILKNKAENIDYKRRNKFFVNIKILFLFAHANLIWRRYIKNKIKRLKKEKELYEILEKKGCFRDLKVNIYLFRIIWREICKHVNGKYDDGVAANFAFATLLYDVSFDLSEFNKYLSDFNGFIYDEEPVNEKDEFLKLFKESVDFVQNKVSKTTFDKLMEYVRILHVIQLLNSNRFPNQKRINNDVFKVSYAKGGISCLAIICLFGSVVDEIKKNALYEFGAAVQLMDDLFDIDKDLKTGMITIPNQGLLKPDEIIKIYYGSINCLINKFGINTNSTNIMLEMLNRLADEIIVHQKSKK